jgi:trehalose 6-phosphate phosphatase
MSEGEADGATTISWWTRVAPRVRAARRCALFLDFDGTLAELTKEPEAAHMTAATRAALKALAGRPRARLFFISGRRRSDLWNKVRLPGCQYLGLFGFERTARTEAVRSARIQELRTEAEALVAGLQGVWIEDKGLAFVLHHRDAPAGVRTVARRRVRAALRSSSAVRLFESAHGLEVVSRDVAGKGATVRQLLRRPALRDAVPIYLGDDLSDESAFLAARRGVTVKVGKARPTAAQYRLAGVGEVRQLLGLLAQALQ